ncbi:MAG: ATP-binding protein [Burkholderiales bacterium]
MPLELLSGRATWFSLNLFWRTFVLLALLLVGSSLVWLQTLRVIESQPRAIQVAEQIASLVNLSRAALVHADPIARVSLIKTMAEQEGVRLQPREPTDVYLPFDTSPLALRITMELQARLGEGAVVARSVNGKEGLWVAFKINDDPNWLQLDTTRYTPTAGKTWLVWLITAVVLSLAGAALIARRINRPLKELSVAATRVRDGDYETGYLDEHAATTEIREVNIGFNQMAQRLAKLDNDRAVMLAGISHDLRTPLARLRLETEMSVADPEAREHMAADITQLDAIIDKFLDYARPDHIRLVPVLLDEVIRGRTDPLKNDPHLRITLALERDLRVLGDPVELARVIQNLIENARRYARTPGTSVARVEISARRQDGAVLVKVRDHGPGVDPDHLASLTQPFFRGDAARTAATGAGLGLSIVDKAVQRMGGKFTLANTESGGLVAHIRLQLAPVSSEIPHLRA